MIYTYSNEYIHTESNTNEKLDNFLIELKNIDLTTKLNQNPFSNPSKNYDTFINILTNIKQRVLPKTRVKFNTKKHKKSQRMSRGILNSINFNTYKNIIRRSIVEAKKLYYKNTFINFPTTCVKHGIQ